VVLDELIKKGLVHKIPRAKKQHFVARPPDEVFDIAKERLENAKSVLPELTALAGTRGAHVRARYFEGAKQVRNAYFETLEQEEKEIVGWISDAVFREVGGEELYKEFQPKRVKKGILSRIIVPNTEIMQKYASDDAQTLKEVRVEASESYLPASEMLLYGSNRVVITSFEEMMVLTIESKKVHDLLKGIFEAHWHALKK
jgi:sugar-specific transcriptional regulator TrmB